MKPTRTYRKWSSMIQRCHNHNHPAYKYYGGRGIKVCEEWRSFKAFQASMGEAPHGLTLGRIDNSKGYEPGNCRWETMKEQAANRRPCAPNANAHKTLKYKAKAAGLPYYVVYQRIRLRGWPEDKALGIPVLSRGGQPGPGKAWQHFPYPLTHEGSVVR